MGYAYKVVGWEFNKELGVGVSGTGTFEMTIPKSQIPDPLVALAIAQADPNIPQYGARASANMDVFCHTQSASLRDVSIDNWVVRVVCGFVPGHLLGNGYVLTTRASVNSVTTSHDSLGQLISVGYTTSSGVIAPTYQAGEIQALYPGCDLTAVGLTATNDPFSVIAPWVGYCNATPWLNYDTYNVLCTGATWEPVSKAQSPFIYRFTFNFQVQLPLPGSAAYMGGWNQMVFWRDSRGRIPTDATLGNGVGIVFPYQVLDFNTTTPFV
jgi:hypothetical protein